MDNFVVSARKYRPQKFEDVVGQQAIADTLKLAICNNKLASAYLFCGPRGVGKTTCARIFAKAINCLHPHANGDACEECESCVSFNQQRSINIQELNAAANNSVEDIRSIIDQIRIPPQMGKYKVVILDEVHMLSTSAGNALLKTLEEPPSYVIFILATTEKQKIMPTILSRCQIFDFNRMEISDIVGNLKMVAQNEGVNCEEAALEVIAQKADGGMRDALSIFDQVNNFSQGNITYESVLQCINALDEEYYFKMVDILLNHNVVEAMLLFNEVVNKGVSGGVFIAGLASHCRDLLMSRNQATLPLLNASENLRQRYSAQAQACSVKFLYYAIRSFDRCSNDYKTSCNKRLSVEITLIEAAQFGEDGESSGPGPAKQLKPLFKQTAALKAAQDAAKAKAAATNNNKVPAASGGTAVANTATPKPAVSKPAAPMQTAATSPAAPTGRMSLQEALNKARELNSRRDGFRNAAAPAGVAQTETKYVAPTREETDDYGDNDETETLSAGEADVVLFSLQQVEAQWKKCSDILKKNDPPMALRMLAMPLECNQDHTITVSLHNEIIQKQFTQVAPFIEDFMRKAFRLDNIRVQTKLLPPEIVRVITNPAELLKKMETENPEFASFVKRLNMQLA